MSDYGEAWREEESWDREDSETDDELAEGDEEEEAEVLPCPECGAEVYEEAERCPVCGSYIVHGADVWAGRPTWWIALGVAGIIMTALALVFGSLVF